MEPDTELAPRNNRSKRSKHRVLPNNPGVIFIAAKKDSVKIYTVIAEPVESILRDLKRSTRY
jgi:hypothetical protein